MQPLFEHQKSFAGFKTRVLELEGDGPAVVLFHGWADSADTWRRVLAKLGREDRRAVAVDLPGFGAADPLKPQPSVMTQLDSFADAVARYAGAGEPTVVCGNSLGGALSIRAGVRAKTPLAG